jgi:hypothetical protein
MALAGSRAQDRALLGAGSADEEPGCLIYMCVKLGYIFSYGTPIPTISAQDFSCRESDFDNPRSTAKLTDC